MKYNKLIFIALSAIALSCAKQEETKEQVAQTVEEVPAPQEVVVAAASNMNFALDSLIAAYKIQNPNADIKATYGATGKLYEQISQEAPFDIFLSADMKTPQKLVDSNLTVGENKAYGIGQLVIWSKTINPNVEGIKSVLNPKVKKIAIGNIVTAPFGIAAKETMEKQGLYSKVESKLVFGENISQTAQFVTSGAADLGFIALSLALSSNMQAESGKYFIVPAENYTPMEQGYVILKRAKDNSDAKKFYDYIATEEAIKILNYYGVTQKAN